MPIVSPPRAADSLLVAAVSPTDSAPRREEVHAAPPPPTRTIARVERRAPTVAQHARAAPQPRPVAPRPRVVPSTAAPQTVASSLPTPVAPPAVAAPAPAAPAAAPAANNALVLEELRAIHAEIDSRRRHVDSLAASLDSLKRGTKPD
jgi:hypothetical protein